MWTTLGSVGINFFLVVVIGFIFVKFPSLLGLMFAKRVVWEVAGDGNMHPSPAKAIGGAMRTKKGVYFYERPDCVTFHGIQGIIAHMASDAKAIRPELQPVFSLMKRLNVSNREKLLTLLNARVMTMPEYKALKKVRQEKKRDHLFSIPGANIDERAEDEEEVEENES
jgi:hypothetical protein